MDLKITLPPWLDDARFKPGSIFPDATRRMELAIELSRQNCLQHGSPFGAAVFETDTGKLVSTGVNLVLQQQLSCLHAEIVALTIAQQRMETHSLSTCELVSSCEPCAMCLGAIPWSGVKRLVYGADEAAARAAGFDEGDKPDNWQEKFTQRGIEVVGGMCSEQAAAVIADYHANGGTAY